MGLDRPGSTTAVADADDAGPTTTTPSLPPAMEPHAHSFLTRQPIVDRRERLYGFRLAGAADRTVMLREEIGANGIKDLVMLVDMRPAHVLDDWPRDFDRLRWMPQIVGNLPADRDFTDHVRAMQRRNVRFCVGDAAPGSPWLGRLADAHCVRVDVRRIPPTHLPRYAAALKRQGPRLIAAGLETRAQMQQALDAGFDLFEGHWFTRPETFASRAVSPVYGAVLRALSLVRAEADLRSIEQALQADPALAFKLLRYVNSAAFGLRSEIHSLRDAVNLLGYRPLGRWLGLALVTARVDAGANSVLALTAITRARIMERLEQDTGGDSGEAFMAGLFSSMDALLDMPMQRVIETLSPPAAVAAALSERSGNCGALLSLAEACELGDTLLLEAIAADLRIDADALAQLHLHALVWAQKLTASEQAGS
jgi:EAL and modified HD-GYP domain-containing signal transduction protein